LHLSEILANRSDDFELLNMAYGGCSNALIVMQIMVGLRFNPEFVIVSFTSSGRYEVDNDVTFCPSSLEFLDLADWIKKRYATNLHSSAAISPAMKKHMSECSDVFDTIKNYFFAVLALQLISKKGIPFCYSLGGLEFCHDYTALVRESFLPNLLEQYHEQELFTNLWYHTEKVVGSGFISNGTKHPYFHVANEQVQTLFYNECLDKLQGSLRNA
jgi:hypothetical protein